MKVESLDQMLDLVRKKDSLKGKEALFIGNQIESYNSLTSTGCSITKSENSLTSNVTIGIH